MYVYLIQSIQFPSRKYIGSTSNLKQRLHAHNIGKCKHTSRFMSWKLVSATWFNTKEKAERFEQYLKAGSGHSFARRHFW